MQRREAITLAGMRTRAHPGGVAWRRALPPGTAVEVRVAAERFAADA